jgi:hypothetical protein
MFINVLEPDTINDPVIIVLPFTFKNGVTIVTPELLDIVPAGPVGPMRAYWTGRSGSSYYYYIIISTCMLLY